MNSCACRRVRGNAHTGEGLIGTVFRDPKRVAAVVRRGEAVLSSPSVQRLCTPAERAKRESWMRDRKAPAPQPTTAADDATYVMKRRMNPNCDVQPSIAHAPLTRPARACVWTARTKPGGRAIRASRTPSRRARDQQCH